MSLAQEPRGLAGKGETHLFGADRGAANHPVLRSAFIDFRVRAWVAVGPSGGKIRLGSGYLFFDVRPKGWLVIFDRQQIVTTAFQHDRAGRFILRVQGIQADQAARQVQPGD